ncbi:MAG: ABC transporter permease, partial [Candidatus Acidiferrales bacterium]
ERGENPRQAGQAARREFGNAGLVREVTRDQWGWRWIETFLQDVHYALRMLRKSPGFTAVAVLTLALSIGANTAIFSVVDAALLRPLPYPHPTELVSVVEDLPGVGAQDVGISEPEWQDFQHSGIFEYVSPAWYDENNLTGASQPATVRLLIVAPDYFGLLGVKPELGRIFNPHDDRPGFTGEVVIGDELWRGAFGGDPHILDKSLRLDTDLYRIIGVMPAGFHAPARTTAERNTEVWAASNFYWPAFAQWTHPPRSVRNIPEAIARVKPGLTLAAAQSRMDALVAALQKQYPADYPVQSGWRVRLVPLKRTVVGSVRQSLILLLGAVGLVLLIGCVNVANLLLARASARGREMAIRQVLGGARSRLTRQLITESVLLSLLGGIAGLAILFAARGFLVRLVPDSLPRLNSISIDWTVLLFALGASAIAGVVFGLAPALQAGRLDLVNMLKMEGRGSTGSGQQARTRRVLVVTEFALSMVLMIAAGLLLHSFRDLLNVRPGFNPENVMSVRIRLPYPNIPANDKYATVAQETAFLREVLRRCAMLPGVEEVAMGDPGAIPLDKSQRELNLVSEGQFFFTLEGRDIQSGQPPVADRSVVTPGYLHLLGIPLLRGRSFNDLDTGKAPQVAVINEALARTYWPNGDAIGKRFKRASATAPWITVVGIVANARTNSLAQANAPKIYLSLYQDTVKHLAIFLRGHLDAAASPVEVRKQVQDVDSTLPVFGAQTLDKTLSASLAEQRFSMEMIALFALTALLLASLGIYGVISYIVNERTHEIGIRLALGAQRSNVMRMVLGEGLRLALAGAAMGLVGAMIVSRLMGGLLYGVTPTDPLTFVGVAILLTVVALAACFIPARRAMRVDPMVALRYE